MALGDPRDMLVACRAPCPAGRLVLTAAWLAACSLDSGWLVGGRQEDVQALMKLLSGLDVMD